MLSSAAASDLVQGDRRRPPPRSAIRRSLAIGIAARWSQVSRTSRDRPSPSEPTTRTSGPSTPGTPEMLDVALAGQPDHGEARLRTRSRATRLRLVARAIGIRAAAPADVFQAAAVMRGRAALGDQHAVGTERRGRPDDRPEVARVGDPVQGHDERLALGVQGSRPAGPRVRRTRTPAAAAPRPGGPPAGQPVQLGTRVTSQQRDAVVGAMLEDVAQPVVALGALGDVRVLDRASRPPAPRSTALRPTTHSGPSRAVRSCGAMVRRAAAAGVLLGPVGAVVGPVLGLWGGAACPPGPGGSDRRIRRCCPCPCVRTAPRCAGCCLAWLSPSPSVHRARWGCP